MSRVSSSCFAFGPNESFFYKTPTEYRGRKLSKSINEFLLGIESSVQEIIWAAIGPAGADDFFFAWKDLWHKVYYTTGADTSAILKGWLATGAIEDTIRVTLGPNGSFFAWDDKRVRWHNIPLRLEQKVQSWFSPKGWIHGPPRIVSLGCSGAYFALTTQGSLSCYGPSDTSPMTHAWTNLMNSIHTGKITPTNIGLVNLSSCDEDLFVIIYSDLSYDGFVPDPIEDFETSIDDLFSEAEARIRREERQRTSKEAKQHATDTKPVDPPKPPRVDPPVPRSHTGDQPVSNEELARLYIQWHEAWELDISVKKLLTTFPHLPTKVCTCNRITCQVPKAEPGSLRACHHDVERFLRSSGHYSIPWLRKQRLTWHPDRFGTRCDPDFRKELKRKATELYTIYGILIEQEMKGQKDVPGR